jgi:hypothetical protein
MRRGTGLLPALGRRTTMRTVLRLPLQVILAVRFLLVLPYMLRMVASGSVANPFRPD